MNHRLKYILRTGISIMMPVFGSLLAGSVLILISGNDPIATYINLFDTGFSCHDGGQRCAILTALQFATPLIFSGLSATVALRSGFFSIGQAGQMLLGAAAATWVGANFQIPFPWHPVVALLAAAVVGALWGLIPAILREYLGTNEIIVTLLMNPIAAFFLSFFRLGRLSESVYLPPLIQGTKLTPAFLLGLALAALVYLFLWKTKYGLEIRNVAQAPRFSAYAGINKHRPIFIAMMVSGALAGMAGAVEVLGVQYRFVTTFSAVNDFDGLIVAFAGRLHPIGVILFSILIGGLRAGAIVGLQIRSGIPRELGGALISFVLIFAAMIKFYRKEKHHPRKT